ncbi:MAG TPA: class I SAM-dependent methyltransferase [Candidatus Binataceae bacterium]
MIKVLRNWQEVGEATLALQRAGLPLHETPQKNFDHFVLREALAGLRKDATIVDLGCGRANTLGFLHALRFTNLRGVDLVVERYARLRQAMLMLRERTTRRPFGLFRGDLTSTPLAPGSCDVAVSISTIEHGVDVERFLKEVARLLKPGGILFVTTDYWEDKIDTAGVHEFGLPWQIFSRDQIVALVQVAARVGLKPVANEDVPACAERPVFWHDCYYTFIAVLFRKS